MTSRAAGYVRVSTPIQAKEGESLSTQRQAIEKYCKSKEGVELVEIYADEGISGAVTEKRHGLLRLLEDAKAKRFDCLIIHRLSRFGRNARELLNNVEELNKNGVMFISLKENIDLANPYGRAMLGMLASIAQLERDIINEQMNENKITRWKRGDTFIGKPPYGYLWNKDKKVLEINPVESDVYKRIVNMYIHEGMSYRDITIKLKEEGIICKRAPFSNVTIQYILNNPAYYGNYILNQYQYEGNRRKKVYNIGGKKKAILMKPSSEHITFNISPLISKSEWDKVQEKRKFNIVKGKRISISRDYWLRDLLVCAECGATIKPHHGSTRKNGTFPRYYSCSWASTSKKGLKAAGKSKCKLPTIKAEEIESEVWSSLINKLSFGGFELGGEYCPSYLERSLECENYEKQIKQLDIAIENMIRELKRKERAKQNIYTMIEDERFDINDCYDKLRGNDKEMIELKSRINDFSIKRDALQSARANSFALLEFVKDNSEWLENMQIELANLRPDDKKIFSESLIGKIAVYKDVEAGAPKPWSFENLSINFNRAIFERFASEGKISRLDKNGPFDPAASQF
jgi:site-specific DNA recombinase